LENIRLLYLFSEQTTTKFQELFQIMKHKAEILTYSPEKLKGKKQMEFVG
jgi:hypothetical protein